MSPLSEFLSEELAAGSFPGASLLVGSSEGILDRASGGSAAVEPAADPVRLDTLWDLASLTKPLAAAALVRISEARGLVLSDPPGRFLPEWKKTAFRGITVEMLLTHTSGLPSWFPVYVRGEGPAAYRRTLAQIEPETTPGSAVVYSDVGFLVLGEVLEIFLAGALDVPFAELVARPSESEAAFRPAAPGGCAATEKGDAFERRMTQDRGLAYAGFRGGVVRGEVHDGNAFRRGGVAAHAGLFGTAEDVWRLARPWLDGGARPWTSDRTPQLPEARGLGWQGARGAGSAISEFSSRAFGHTGFTGTSLWLDPERDRIFVLLTNRIHPAVPEESFHPVRRRFHHAALGVV